MSVSGGCNGLQSVQQHRYVHKNSAEVNCASVTLNLRRFVVPAEFHAVQRRLLPPCELPACELRVRIPR